MSVSVCKASAPSFTETPRDLKVVEGQTATLTCNVYGAPRPVITWSRGNVRRPVRPGNRVTILPSGSLEITVRFFLSYFSSVTTSTFNTPSGSAIMAPEMFRNANT